MKVQPNYTRSYTEIDRNNNKVGKKQNPAFGNFAVATMDAIERGGLFASFAVQDILGSCVPRTITGFYRNKDITGKYNYAEASEVSIREFVSSITMFLIPMGILAVAKRGIGRSCDVPAKFIKALGETLQKTAKDKPADLKKAFYNNAFTKMFLDSGIKNSQNQAAQFADKLIELESKDKKTYKQGIAELKDAFSVLKKENSSDITEDFFKTTLKYGKESEGLMAQSSFGNFVKYISDYSHDAFEAIKKNQGDVEEFIGKFNLKRAGTRLLANLTMALSVIGFYMYIPKLYTLHKVNPALAGLEPETKGTVAANESK